MSPEAQQEPLAEPSNAGPGSVTRSGQIAKEVLAFKFGGSSLFGAERMLHAASLVRQAALDAQVVVVVSAMKGVTDRLLAIARSLEAGCRTDARRDAEQLLRLHVQVLGDLQLEPYQHQRVERELHFLGKDFLYDASPKIQPSADLRAALQDRLASYGERFSARFPSALPSLS
jgi:bifunctional aspartokinase / homoserine dehydrogenase 1